MSEICAAVGRLGGLVVAASFLVGTSLAVAQEAFAPGLCVVPVKNSARISLGDEWPMVPFPKPILKGGFPYERLSLWTVSVDNALVPLGDGFPYSWLDKFAVEMTSGRVLGIAPAASGPQPGVYVFDPANGRFRMILPAPYTGPDGASFRFVNTIAHVPRLGATLIGTDNGVFRLRGETVEPWAGATGREVGDVHSIADLPVHGALMLAGSKDAMLRHDDGSVEKLFDTSDGWFSRKDQVTGAVESKQPGRIVAKGVFADHEIEMRPRRGGGFSPSNYWTFARHPDQGGDTVARLTRSGEYLLLRRTAWSGEYGSRPSTWWNLGAG